MTGSGRIVRILSYNLHKGRNLARRDVLAEIRDALRRHEPDILLLQEVRGFERRFFGGDAESDARAQHAFIAEGLWHHVVYGRNVVRRLTHHGNAILSRFPVREWENIDVSCHRVEKRSILHAVVDLPRRRRPLHALCLHFGLLERWRRSQRERLAERIRRAVRQRDPLVVAGDFNDWRQTASDALTGELGLVEAFRETSGDHARTYPSLMPALKLDRVYVRNAEIVRAERLDGPPWNRLSDHTPLVIDLIPGG